MLAPRGEDLNNQRFWVSLGEVDWLGRRYVMSANDGNCYALRTSGRALPANTAAWVSWTLAVVVRAFAIRVDLRLGMLTGQVAGVISTSPFRQVLQWPSANAVG